MFCGERSKKEELKIKTTKRENSRNRYEDTDFIRTDKNALTGLANCQKTTRHYVQNQGKLMT